MFKEHKWKIDAEFKKVKSDDGNLYIEGYANTFAEDRDGDTVAKDAFDDTVDEFMLNPVILTDHKNSVNNVVGRVVDLQIDDKGLWIKALLSNSEDEYTRMVRTKVKEGLLRAFSIGGMFKYDFVDDKALIKKVHLFEISIVPIPANQFSLFNVAKSLKLDNSGKKSVEKIESDQKDSTVVAPAKDGKWMSREKEILSKAKEDLTKLYKEVGFEWIP